MHSSLNQNIQKINIGLRTTYLGWSRSIKFWTVIPYVKRWSTKKGFLKILTFKAVNEYPYMEKCQAILTPNAHTNFVA